MKTTLRVLAVLLAAILLMSLVPAVLADARNPEEQSLPELKGQADGASVTVTAEANYYLSWPGPFIGDLCTVEGISPGYNGIVDYKGNIRWKFKQDDNYWWVELYQSGFVGVKTNDFGGQFYTAAGIQLSDGSKLYDAWHGWECTDHSTGKTSWIVTNVLSSTDGTITGQALISASGQTMFAQDFGEIYSGMITCKENGKWGLRKLYGTLLLSCTYDALELIGPNRLIGIRNGNGFILDLQGNTVKSLGAMTAIESLMKYYSLERILFQSGSKWGVMDFQGNVLIPCEYDSLSYWNSRECHKNMYFGNRGSARYSVGEGSNGAKIYLGQNDDYQISYYYVEPFGANAYIRRDGESYKYSVLNKIGEALLPGQYKSYSINESRTHLLLEVRLTEDNDQETLTYKVYRTDMSEVMELKGLTYLNDDGIVNLNEGTARFYNFEGYQVGEIQNVTQIDGNQNVVCVYRHGKYGLADFSGNLLTDFLFTDYIGSTTQNINHGELIEMKRGGSWYLYNTQGRQVLDCPLDEHLFFQRSSPYSFFLSNGKYGVCQYIPAAPECSVSVTGKHCWERGSIVKEASCTESGEREYRCKYCGATKNEAVPIDPDAHAWTLTEVLTEGEEGLHSCTGLYTCTRCNETKEARLCAAEVFTDMPAEGNWAHDPIDWAYFNGITAGKSPTTFNPKDTVTRAEAMTFLWKTLGSPEPETTENPFADVKEGKYYYKPVLWAVENGVTTGTSETTFSPKQNCTRAQILTFLWIAAGKPEPETEENPFTDVQETKYYYKAVLWGVENHITSGVAPDEFGPNQTCTRAQIVAFLYLAKDLMPQVPDTP